MKFHQLSTKNYSMITSQRHRKSTAWLEKAINMEAKCIAKKINIDDRINSLAKNPAFITLKDHKPNFRSSLPCRLINPPKNELSRVSKFLLENINKQLIELLNVNQWKNSESVIDWFNTIENKHQCVFIQLDIVEFYPSITEEILDRTISFAKQHVEITDDHLRIIKHCRKSLLFDNNDSWRKKDTDSCFDVTMGSYDGAETWELVGTHILSLLAKVIDHNHSGLYRDDGLILLRHTTGLKMDRIRKDVIKTFKDVGFKIDIKRKLTVVDFLDGTFILSNGTYKPYKKRNDTLLYINASSNHPPQVIKQLPSPIADRLSKNLSKKCSIKLNQNMKKL